MDVAKKDTLVVGLKETAFKRAKWIKRIHVVDHENWDTCFLVRIVK